MSLNRGRQILVMEKLYQYLWQSHMFGRKLHEADGGEVEVIDPGRLNTDAGPDFFNSKIRIAGTEWAGNVEIHVKASDWYRHGHQNDPAYDNIILHVVAVGDRRVERRDGSLIPQVEVAMPPEFYSTFSTLSSGSESVRCGSRLAEVGRLAMTDWLETLSVERMQQKALRIKNIHTACNCDWEQTCFVVLARALGFGLNGDPFEMLARSIQLKYLHHHSDNPVQLQALLFGQAAMLDSSSHIFDEYYQLLCREYYFLARKYGLRPMRVGLWKYARTRPQNFPHRRIAFLAKACENGFSLFSRLVELGGDPEATRALFDWKLEGYWHEHSSFDVTANSMADSLSEGSRTLLLINAVAPLLYAYGAHRGDPELAERGLVLLEKLPAESNSYLRHWAELGLRADNALRSQALMQLRREYCDNRRCLSCRFGHQLLKRTVKND
jgi:hypothetical protein